MIYLSAGHNSQSKTIKTDPGAVNKQGIKEGDLTIEFRNLVAHELNLLGIPFKTDSDEESLIMYLNRIKTGNGSVVIEYHFDSAASESVTGTTGLVEAEADRLDRAFAKELTDTTASVLGISNRGIIAETQSHRGRLGLMREEGIICLVELGFISNHNDLLKYHTKKKDLAKVHAMILKKYEGMVA